MKLKLLIGVLVFLIVLNLATIGTFFYTQWKRGSEHLIPPAPQREHESSRHHAPDGTGRRGGPYPPKFHLHEEKRTQLRQLLGEFYAETSGTRARILELEQQAFAILQRDSVPRDSLDTILEEISRLRLDINRSAFEKLIKTKAHLEPAQQRMFFKAILEARPDQRGRSRDYRGQHKYPRNESN